jgi:hypothetical protein
MDMDELLRKIARAGSATANASTVRHGNLGGAGDYSIVSITVGQETYRFRQTDSSSWSDEAVELANKLAELHAALESDMTKSTDYGIARNLEDVLGAGQYIYSQIAEAKDLLRKYGRSLDW